LHQQKRRSCIFGGEEREKKGKNIDLPTTNRATNEDTCLTNMKRRWWWFQRHDEMIFLDIERCHTRCLKDTGASHARSFFVYFFSQLQNCPWANFIITKNILKNQKHLLNSIFFFKGIFIVSLCILIVYYFFIFC